MERSEYPKGYTIGKKISILFKRRYFQTYLPKSIVDAVMAIQPDGLRFGKIED